MIVFGATLMIEIVFGATSELGFLCAEEAHRAHNLLGLR